MPRQPRYRIPGLPQHVVQRGNNRQPTFYEPVDYRVYQEHLLHAAAAHRCEIHAYVLMTNHVHLLVTPRAADSLPKMMQSLGRRYVRYVNREYRRTGTLWEGRYKACLVDSDNYLLACYRYVEMNPVRAGMVSDPGEYEHSSYRHNALGVPDALISHHAAYDALAELDISRCLAYRRLFRSAVDDSLLASIRQTTGSCLVLGNDGFKEHIETILAQRVRPGGPGRPRKIAV